MSRVLISFLMVFMLPLLAACGDIDIGNQGITEFNESHAKNPVGAREMLSRLNIPYTVDEFVECARQSDVVAVELFLMSGMNPDAKDKDGLTAMNAAKQAGHEKIIEILKEAGKEKSESE